MARPSKIGERTSAAKTRKSRSLRRRKPAKTKRSATIRQKRGLDEELKEARDQQAATSEILEAINRSGFDLDGILQTVVSTAARLCNTGPAGIFLLEGDIYRFRAGQHLSEAYREHEKRSQIRAGLGTLVGRVALQKGVVRIVDALNDIEYEDKEAAAANNLRSMLGVPLLRDGKPVGVFALARTRVEPFSESQIRLVSTFANQAVIAIENTRMFNETQEALERQTATADILKVIASSPSDAQPVFEAIGQSANKLVGAHGTTVLRIVGDMVELAAFTPVGEEADAMLRSSFPLPIAGNPHYEKMRRGEIAEAADTEAAHSPLRDIARVRGYRSRLLIPLKDDRGVVGAISVTRKEPGAFAAHHVQLLQTFADQAVIAIENARLFNETQEALERQTATGDILKVIASSPDNAQPVFEAIAQSAKRLFGAHTAVVTRVIGDMIHLAAFTADNEAGNELLRRSFPFPLSTPDIHTRVVRTGAIEFRTDVLSEPNVPPGAKIVARARGYRSILVVPMLREGNAIGTIVVTRPDPGPFGKDEIELLQTFADQAAIAIGNVQLFDAVQARTRDLQEALRQQTATGEVLKVIASSPTDVNPALQAIVESACTFCDAYDAGVLLRAGDDLHFSAHHGPIRTGREARPINRGWVVGRSVIDKVPVQVSDFRAPEAAEFPEGQRQSREQGHLCTLSVPLLREGEAIGAIALRRMEPVAFSQKQVALLQTFADQAVIAIGNVRLFEEVQARTRDLSESLEQQTATSEVLSVISRSAGDLAPVFDAMLSKAMQLCGANFGVLNTYDGAQFRTAATYGLPPAYDEFRRSRPLNYGPATAPARLLEGEPFVELPDLLESEAYCNGEPNRRALVDLGGARCLLAVPLLKDGRVVGNVMIFRQENRPFSEKQIALLQQFAAQAMIAIENARLLNELRERTDDLSESLQQQTATSEVLRVISSSSGDLQPVFRVMLDNALKICEATYGNMMLYGRDGLNMVELHNSPPAFADLFKSGALVPPPGTALGRVIATSKVVHIPDLLAESGNVQQTALRRVTVERMRARTLLAVPMLRESELVGIIVIYRQEVRPFSEKQIELVTNFADQAVIAIENARLLNELRQRTDDLSKSLDDLRTAQDRLVQTEKLASLGQLTAGIAHEIKNPLNFVNNFSALSAELTDELNDLLKDAALTDKMRQEVQELTRLLLDNLNKVVQHGRRADSIVKNMLLHSREGSGERRSADINAIVEDSLNLAYHGARAEKSGFSITLLREFDASAGSAELFPQEITRALLNLLSNGFYAATKRKTEKAGAEPTVLATTKDLGSNVEIRIRDNGAGISPEVREKMFNPFFTTKPTGEGTGLGLSMTHDIIVKQHGGRIDVETRLGEFTEFIITLPRSNRAAHG